MWNSHHQNHFTQLRNCIPKSYIRIYISFLEKTFVHAKAYQKFRVTTVHLVGPQGPVFLLLLAVMTTGMLFWKEELSKVCSTWAGRTDGCLSLTGLCFHTLSMALRSMHHRTRGESGREACSSPETADPESSGAALPRRTPHRPGRPRPLWRWRRTSPTSEQDVASGPLDCQIHPFFSLGSSPLPWPSPKF